MGEVKRANCEKDIYFMSAQLFCTIDNEEILDILYQHNSLILLKSYLIFFSERPVPAKCFAHICRILNWLVNL